MLKWTINQRTSSSSVLSSCSETTPSVTCCSSSFRLQSTSPFKLKPRSNVASRNKENRVPSRKSSGKRLSAISDEEIQTNRNRDNEYMDLEDIPVALRDVSNQWSPKYNENYTTANESERKSPLSRKRKTISRLKKSPCKVESHFRQHRRSVQLPVSSTPKLPPSDRNDVLSNAVSDSSIPVEKRKRPCLDSGRHKLISRPVEQYRRITKKPSVINPTDVAVINNRDNVSFATTDNPLYFAISTSPPEEPPDILFHKSIPKTITSNNNNNNSNNSNNNNNKLLSKLNNAVVRISEVSPLARKLALLRLNYSVRNLSAIDKHDESTTVCYLESSCSNAALAGCSRLLSEISVNTSAKEDDDDDNGITRKMRKKSGGKVKRKCSYRTVDSNIVDNENSRSNDDIIDNRKRRCVIFDAETFNLNTPPPPIVDRLEKEEERVSSIVDSSRISSSSIDLNEPSTLKRQKVIRKPKIKNPVRRTFESCLTLPDGIPSPLDDKSRFRILSPIPIRSDSSIVDETLANENDDRDNRLNPTESVVTWNSHENRPFDFGNADGIKDKPETIISAASTRAIEETNSTSRRCLLFASPIDAHFKKKSGNHSTQSDNDNDKGQIDLRIHFEADNVIIHVKKVKNLRRPNGEASCNAYVKVNLLPSESVRSLHRTCVRKDCCNPNFDHKFFVKINENDTDKKILISVWHRHRSKRKSEFLGCVSFLVKDVIRKDINGAYKLLSHSNGLKSRYSISRSCPFIYARDLMANQSASSIDERTDLNELNKIHNSEIDTERRQMTINRKETDRGGRDECLFLQHLELDPVLPTTSGPKEQENKRGGRTPFTTTYKLIKQSNASFGFSVAWTHPPRVERVEANLPADIAGIRPGDYVIFVNKTNVVMLHETEILDIIKDCGNKLVLEIYRKPFTSNNVLNHVLAKPASVSNYFTSDFQSAATDTIDSVYAPERPSQLPHITFSSEVGSGIIV